MKVATLVYVQDGGATLMLHRIKKQDDIHAGKWNGLGGKVEAGESPEACAIREVEEESGLRLRNPLLKGVLTFPDFAKGEDWYAFVFVAHDFTGELIDSAEGALHWIPTHKLLELNLWEGDRVFLPWLAQPGFFSGRFWYKDGAFVRWEAFLYDEQGVHTLHNGAPGSGVAVASAAAPTASDEASAWQGFDDEVCWLCSGETVKRNCKIICQVCGFTRDCSDP